MDPRGSKLTKHTRRRPWRKTMSRRPLSGTLTLPISNKQSHMCVLMLLVHQWRSHKSHTQYDRPLLGVRSRSTPSRDLSFSRSSCSLLCVLLAHSSVKCAKTVICRTPLFLTPRYLFKPFSTVDSLDRTHLLRSYKALIEYLTHTTHTPHSVAPCVTWCAC